jgi:hypothetical protein
MTAATTIMDTNLSNALDRLSRGLDRVAGRLCDLDDAGRAVALERLRRVGADLSAVVAELERGSTSAEPAASH